MRPREAEDILSVIVGGGAAVVPWKIFSVVHLMCKKFLNALIPVWKMILGTKNVTELPQLHTYLV
jgi:hypothetical protein